MRRYLAFALVAAFATPARADALEDARKLEASLDYDKALAVVESAIASGRADREHVAALHFEAGKLAAGLDHADAAQDHFARALALDSSLSLPPGTSPKITAPFELGRVRTGPLRIDQRRDGDQVIVGVAADPLRIVASARVVYLDRDHHHREAVSTEGPPFVVEIAPDATEIEVIARDAYGNPLYLGLAVEHGVLHEGEMIDHPATSWYGSWKAWAASAAFAGGITGLCAWRESVAQDDWNRLKADAVAHDYSELRAVEDRGRSWALATDIGIGITSAAVVAAVVAQVVHRPADRGIAIRLGPSSVGVVGEF